MKRLKLIPRDQQGSAAVEFALAVPILILFIWGILQVALLFQANAGMQLALGEGARAATLCVPAGNVCTVPSDTTIKTKMSDKLFGQSDGIFNVQDPTTSAGYKTLTITYTRNMNFLFFNGPAVTLTRTKKVYTAG